MNKTKKWAKEYAALVRLQYFHDGEARNKKNPEKVRQRHAATAEALQKQATEILKTIPPDAWKYLNG